MDTFETQSRENEEFFLYNHWSHLIYAGGSANYVFVRVTNYPLRYNRCDFAEQCGTSKGEYIHLLDYASI